MTGAVVIAALLQGAWWVRSHVLLRGRALARVILALFVLVQLAWLASVWRWGIPSPDGSLTLAWHAGNALWALVIVPLTLVVMLLVGSAGLAVRVVRSRAG